MFGGRILLSAVAVALVAGLFYVIFEMPEMLAGTYGLTIWPMLVGIGAGFAAPEFVKLEFYKAVAQALPVLLLTMVIDKRRESQALARGRARRRPQFTVRWLMVIYLLLASFYTFRALAEENAMIPKASKFVIGTLVGIVTFLVLSLVADEPEQKEVQEAAEQKPA